MTERFEELGSLALNRVEELLRDANPGRVAVEPKIIPAIRDVLDGWAHNEVLDVRDIRRHFVRDVVLAVQGERAALADRWDLLNRLARADPALRLDLEQFPGPELRDPSEEAHARQREALERSDDLVEREVLDSDQAWRRSDEADER